MMVIVASVISESTSQMQSAVMSNVEQDIANFANFALHRIETVGADLTIEELFDQWQIENPSNEQYVENVAAIRAAIDDFQRGERGTIAGSHSNSLRRDLGNS